MVWSGNWKEKYIIEICHLKQKGWMWMSILFNSQKIRHAAVGGGADEHDDGGMGSGSTYYWQ